MADKIIDLNSAPIKVALPRLLQDKTTKKLDNRNQVII